MKKKAKAVLQSLPLSLNGFYGDAMQPSQWEDTVSKLENLKNSGHRGEIMIPTKYLITDEQIEFLRANYPSVWVFYAITGLEEKYNFKDYEQSYYKLCEAINKVVCVIRPIVPNKNDTIDMIMPILEMVKNGNKLLTYTGYRDPRTIGSKKYTDTQLFNKINDYCELNKIQAKEKCACMVAAYNNTQCHIHDQTTIENVDFLELIGYKIAVDNNKLFLYGHKNTEKISKGDVAFVNIVSKNKPIIIDDISQSEILSFKCGDTNLVCSSSWFSWARQVPCIIGCNYCFANYSSNVRINLEKFGCNPIELLELIQ
jgi:hypothetical protein